MNNNSKRFRELTRVLERNLELINSGDCSLCDVTTAQCHTLVEIGRNQDSMLKDLAAILQIDVSTASKVVEELVKKGYVRREPSSKDRRSVQINLTAKGWDIFDQIERDMDHIFESILTYIEPTKQNDFLNFISLYNEAIENWKEDKERE